VVRDVLIEPPGRALLGDQKRANQNMTSQKAGSMVDGMKKTVARPFARLNIESCGMSFPFTGVPFAARVF
jgi:hypothetical protein